MTPIQRLARVFGEAFANSVIGNSSPNNKLRIQSEKMTAAFDLAVDTLRLKFPNPVVMGVTSLMWRLIGNKMILSASMNVPTISFTMMGGPGKKPAAFVLCPPLWNEMLEQDYIYQLGGVVFCASQCCDFYNEKFQHQQNNPIGLQDQDVQRRAWAYEAEYLNVVKEHLPEHQFNDYQKKVMEEFPNGLLSLPENLVYQSKPFVIGEKNPFWQQAVINTNNAIQSN